ncbi:hypothetical protein FHG87_021428 [Trinorchestia longiramus]|nr:hypothetical protein FHG87_021428 [Trinorchestia longiramus]
MFAKVRTSHLQHKEDSMLATVKGQYDDQMLVGLAKAKHLNEHLNSGNAGEETQRVNQPCQQDSRLKLVDYASSTSSCSSNQFSFNDTLAYSAKPCSEILPKASTRRLFHENGTSDAANLTNSWSATVVEWSAARVLYRVSACAERLLRVRNPAMNTSCFSFHAVSSHLSIPIQIPIPIPDSNPNPGFRSRSWFRS